MGDTFRLPRINICSRCGQPTNARTQQRSEDGLLLTVSLDLADAESVNICFYCGLVSYYRDDLTLAPFTDEDWKALSMMDRLQLLRVEQSRAQAIKGHPDAWKPA